MAASGGDGSDSEKNTTTPVNNATNNAANNSGSSSKKEESGKAEGGGGGGSGGAANGGGGNGGASGGGGGGGASAGGGGGGGGGTGKERDYIWSEDAVHVLLDHFLEKYMSYEKGMIRNADWVEIAARVNQQLDGNKPVKTPEQCKNKVDNLKKQYRKERRRGSLGPASTNWSFFSRMHDIFESDYKKASAAAAAAAAAASAADDAEEPPPPPPPAQAPPPVTGASTRGAAAAAARAAPDHYLASREFARKDELFSKRYRHRSETPPPPPPPPPPAAPPQSASLMLDHHHQQHHHHPMHPRHHEREEPAKKRSRGANYEPQPQVHHGAPHGERRGGNGGGRGSNPDSSDSGGAAGAAAGNEREAASRASKLERKMQRHQLAALRRDFMEGFTGFAEVMLKIEVAKMEMQRDLERQRAEMELHRTQMMLSNQLQLAKYLKSSPLQPPQSQQQQHNSSHEWPNFGFADAGGGSSNNRLQLAIPIFPGFTALDAVGPYEVLHLLPNVDVLFVSHEPGLYAAGMGMLTLQATASFDQVQKPQILVVPGGSGTRRLLQDRPILDWIRKVHEHTLYTASVCTGSLLLGAAGLLRGVEATTHWNAHEMLADFGAKPVQSRIVRQGKIITAAGVSAGIDMALQLAALLTDEATAKMLQLYIEYDPQPPFDTGTVSKAGPELTSRAKELSKLRQAAA